MSIGLVRQEMLEHRIVSGIGLRSSIGGVIMMQYLPFADAKALAVYDTFERGTYQLVSAAR